MQAAPAALRRTKMASNAAAKTYAGSHMLFFTEYKGDQSAKHRLSVAPKLLAEVTTLTNACDQAQC
jgi:hypothetical protein